MELWTIVVLVAIVSPLTRGQSLMESRFHKGTICNVNDRIADGCTKEASRQSKLRCLAECSLQTFCIGASLEKDTGKCFIHKACNLLPACDDTPDPNHDYYAKESDSLGDCVHGVWDSDNSSCVCAFGTFGDRCDKARLDCHAYYHYNYFSYDWDYDYDYYDVEGGSIYIDPHNDGNLYQVRCMHGVILLMMNAGGMSFNRTWNEYVNGFESSDESDYWLGLKAWHGISNSNSRCEPPDVVTRLRFKGQSAVTRWYDEFVIGNEDANFSFTFKDMSYYFGQGPGFSYDHNKDCLENLRNVSFSTWDKNNGDDPSKNCPSQVGFGWWYPQDCNISCNFLSWGLEDWNMATSQERFSMLGLDMSQAASHIEYFQMFLYGGTCGSDSDGK